MSDTAVTTTGETAPPTNPDGMLLDGEAPRLGSTPIIAPAPMGGSGTPATAEVGTATPAPLVPPVLTAPDSSMQPIEDGQATGAAPVSAADMPKLPTAGPVTPITTEDAPTEADSAEDAEAEHPMAHLMPPKSKPTEASIRAAEQRSIKKAKARKIKIAVAAGALLAAALAGPPLVSWMTNAIDESGGLTTEEPAD